VQFNANQLQAGQGSGLGLFISKGIAEQHKGTLTVQSPGLGQGATFTLELPAYRKVGGGHGNGTGAGNGGGGNGNGGSTSSGKSESVAGVGQPVVAPRSKRVLVVDDALSNRKMMVRLLRSRGHTCEEAENGQQALDRYRDLRAAGTPADIIVMDYEMPVMNGPTATKLLREAGCDRLIIGVTGNLLPEDVRYFRLQGADAVLGKPLDIQAFEELLRRPQTAGDGEAGKRDGDGSGDGRGGENEVTVDQTENGVAALLMNGKSGTELV
jgi:CheY-like chemotaxis protein